MVSREQGIATLLFCLLLVASCSGDNGSGQEKERSPFDPARGLTSQALHAEAAEAYQRLAVQFAEEGDAHGEWKATLERARSLYRIPRKEQALELIGVARELAADVPERQARTTYYHAAFLHQAGNLGQALVVAGEARDWSDRTDDPDLISYGHGVLATVLSLSGRYDEAVAINEGLVTRFRDVDPDPRNLAYSLHEVAIDYKHLGRFDDALFAYEQAIEFFREHDDKRWLGIGLANLGNLHFSHGDAEQALALYLESIRIAEELDNTYSQGLGHHSVSNLYAFSGNHAKAREHAERALEINRSASQPYGELASLISLAALELEEERASEAEALLREALTLADETGYGFEAADARINLAVVLVELGRAEDGLALVEDALQRSAEMDDPNLHLQALSARARVLAALGRLGDADRDYETAIAALESWRGRLAMGDLRLGIAERRIALFEDAIENLMRQGQVEKAFAVAERARARLLLELMAERRDFGAADRREELLRQLQTRHVAAARTRSPEAAKRLEDQIDALIAELNAFERREGERDPALAAARFPRPISAVAVRDGLISEQRALIAWFWGEHRVYGWWLDGEGTRGVDLGPADALRPLVEFLRAAIESPTSPVDWRPAAQRVYERLVAPLRPTAVQEWLVVPSGPLNRLPLEVLIPAAGKPPLGATRRIIYGPSASVLTALAQAPESPGIDRAMLALGAPAFAGRTDPGQLRGVALSPLPWAEGEARFVYELYEPQGADLLLGEDATLDAWLAAAPQRYRYLHFATHAIVSDRRPSETRIALSGGGLDLPTIRAQALRAQLVTVSACDSAIGKDVRGEGIVGLPHSFLASGARGVVVALWSVEDEAAAGFMRDFYEELHRGRPAAEALASVRRRWMLESGERSHPARWAPFIQIGGLAGGR